MGLALSLSSAARWSPGGGDVRVSKRLYRVYLWRMPGAMRLAEQVWAPDSEAALYQVMRAKRVSYSPYACVVPDNERLPIVDYQHVRCSLEADGLSSQAAWNGVR
jgi:hypothetical protein